MKKYVFLILAINFFLAFILFLSRSPVPSGDVILNKLSSHTPMPVFYYSNLSGKKVLSYTLEDNKLIPQKQKSISFTEGFIPQATYTFYLTLLEDFATQKGITLPPSLHDFYEDEELAVLSFSGTLKDIYIIEKSNSRIHPLVYPESFDLGVMYVSHIQKLGDYLLILAGEAETYNALLYKVYLPTFEVVDAIRLATHPSALSQLHYTLTSSGEAIFINGQHLKVYNTRLDTYKLVPLDYTATTVITSKDQTISLGQSAENIHYTVFDSTFTPLTTGILTLPSPTSTPVDILAQANILYITSFDPKAKRYTNYLILYDLTTGEMLYTLGIKPLKNYALLDINLE